MLRNSLKIYTYLAFVLFGSCQSQMTLIKSLLRSFSAEFGANCASIITDETSDSKIINFNTIPLVHVRINKEINSQGLN